MGEWPMCKRGNSRVTCIHASRKPRRAANFKRYFDFGNLLFDARVVILLNCTRVVFYNLFRRYTALSIQKLRSRHPIRADPERVLPKALHMGDRDSVGEDGVNMVYRIICVNCIISPTLGSLVSIGETCRSTCCELVVRLSSLRCVPSP
jgi:hypothetical protein